MLRVRTANMRQDYIYQGLGPQDWAIQGMVLFITKQVEPFEAMGPDGKMQTVDPTSGRGVWSSESGVNRAVAGRGG